MSALGIYLALLLATLALEVPVAAALVSKAARPEVWRTALFANLASHPLATGLMWSGYDFLRVELSVIAFEFLAYAVVGRLSWSRALVIAIVANTVTIVASFVLIAGPS